MVFGVTTACFPTSGGVQEASFTLNYAQRFLVLGILIIIIELLIVFVVF